MNIETAPLSPPPAPPPAPPPPAPSSRRLQAILLCGTWLIAAWMLFAQLGYYALWDDEAFGALAATSILATGDTKAQIGHNLLAYRNGLVLHNLRMEGEAPFVPYLVAPFLAVFGQTAFAARLPLALLSFGTVTLMLWWVWQLRVRVVTVAIFCIALLGNTSLFLYARNSRYYAVSMACFTLAAWLHLHRRGRWWEPWAMGATGAVLMLSNYTLFICLCACLLIDMLFWEHRHRPYTLRDLVQAGVLPLLSGLAILAWWNPLRTGIGERLVVDTYLQKLTLFGWHWRDMDRSEMLVGPLLAITLVLACLPRFRWLRRGVVATLVYAVVFTMLSIQTVSDTTTSDIRYFAALLPLFIALQTFTLAAAPSCKGWQQATLLALAVGLFFTNFAQGIGWPLKILRSTPLAFAREVQGNYLEPYTFMATWVNTFVKEGQTVLVQPMYMTYPLMYHAPKAIYAWQLTAEKQAQHPELAPIHFATKVPPDYLIVSGEIAPQLMPQFEAWGEASYRLKTILPVYWRDHYRPEILWHSFAPIPLENPAQQGILIFERVTKPPHLLRRPD